MKRKNLPMSALLTGLLAMPVMGIAPPVPGQSRANAPIVLAEQFPAVMPAEIDEQIRRIARGQRPDASGMQNLQRRLALQMQQRLANLTGKKRRDDWVQVQLTQADAPAPTPATPTFPTATAPTTPLTTPPATAPAPDGEAGLRRALQQPDVQKATEVVSTRSYGSTFDTHADGSLTRRTYDDQYDITINRSATGADTITARDRAGNLLVQATGDQLAEIKIPADLLQKIQDARANVNQTHVEIGSPVPANLGTPVPGNSSSTGRSVTLNHTDETYEIAFRSVNGDNHLTVKDQHTGATLYDGPANSEDDYKALPDDAKAKVKTLLQKVK